MEKSFRVLLLLLLISASLSVEVEQIEKLTLRIEEHITFKNCNKTLENIQVSKVKDVEQYFSFVS